MDIARFYKGVADHGGDPDGQLDYAWVLNRIEDDDHPRYGPPLPWSMRPVLDRILHDIYAPAIRAALNQPSLLTTEYRTWSTDDSAS
jgi:hypothetical protein